ncbi:MBL fold metallo-hydrolase [Halobaculum lipolyticum]|uniref:MBL fold metallo-hydrolase n=1 Tax=Halobaculum lipolyticum TaxID=3032001 RepID=A0ABD5WBI3_9EURY|nr:MBL fold metallo-hydrolase [Halobaculum sp. DT31]
MSPHPSDADSAASVRLVRNATLLVSLGGTRLLVDPMLGAAGVDPPVQNTPNERRNPLVDRPDVDLAHDAVLVTHRHNDHFDDAARERLDADVPLVVHPEQADDFREEGFTDVRPLDGDVRVDGLTLTPTPARHGHGDLAAAMAPVTGALVRVSGDGRDGAEGDAAGDDRGDGPTLYLAGDTVWYEGVADTLASAAPDAVVLNAGAARFVDGEPITMDAADVRRTRDAAPADATVAAVHMEAINHCLLTRAELREAVDGVAVPDDGEALRLD